MRSRQRSVDSRKSGAVAADVSLDTFHVLWPGASVARSDAGQRPGPYQPGATPQYVFSSQLPSRLERGLQAASPSALSRLPGISQGPWDCPTRKRRKRRAPFARATATLNKYTPQVTGRKNNPKRQRRGPISEIIQRRMLVPHRASKPVSGVSKKNTGSCRHGMGPNSTSVRSAIEMERAFSALASPVRLPSPLGWAGMMGAFGALRFVSAVARPEDANARCPNSRPSPGVSVERARERGVP